MSRKAIVTAALIILALIGVIAYHLNALPSYALTSKQHADMSAAARNGMQGLSGFDTIGQPGITPLSFHRYQIEYNVQAVKLGESFSKGDLFDGRYFTPAVHADGSYVTYDYELLNLASDTKTTMVLRNSDPELFGNDGMASPDEMRAFYNNPYTELVSLRHDELDKVNGECAVTLEFDGNTLHTNAADRCSRSIQDTTVAVLIQTISERFFR